MLKTISTIATQIISSITGGLVQFTGPSAGTTRVITVPNANATMARTDAAQTFTGNQTVDGTLSAGQVYRIGTYTAGDTTPSVLGVSFLVIQNSGATSITNFTNAVNGQILTLIFIDGNTTVTRNNAYLLSGLNFTSTANDTLTLIYRAADGLWYEVCRSINA
jgi:hypothetical protein